jgi:hypothetical protein
LKCIVKNNDLFPAEEMRIPCLRPKAKLGFLKDFLPYFFIPRKSICLSDMRGMVAIRNVQLRKALGFSSRGGTSLLLSGFINK